MQSIVVGFIDSPEGHAALDRGVAEARLRGCKLIVVHSMVGGDKESDEEYLAANQAMEVVERRLEAEGLPFETHQYVRGQTPSEDLTQAAREFDAEMIVIGVRRRSTTGKVLLGSNALEILHDAHCPVLCVKRSGG
jgi:nucleotide-binding universal stress UspA family protein